MALPSRYGSLILLVFILIFPACSGVSLAAREIPRTCLEKTGNLTPAADMCAYLEELCSEDDRLTLEELGKSGSGRFPVYMVKVNDPAVADAGKLRVMIIGEVHGSEPAGGEALLQFLGRIARNDEKTSRYLKHCTLYVIPCLNPDGAADALEYYHETRGFWIREGRGNSQGLDINRDYLTLYTPEAVLAVQLFNRIQPHVVLDLHEYSTIPLIVAGDGWWKGTYFDFMAGAGRHPDVYPPMAHLARRMVDDTIFPGLRAHDRRCEHYALSNGEFESTSYMGASAASYFNIRNALTILFETAGYDQGGTTIKKRTATHLLSLEYVFRDLIRRREDIIRITAESREFARNRHEITLTMKSKPRKVTLDGRTSDRFSLTKSIVIDGRRYYAPARIRFTEGDRTRRTTCALPQAYVMMTLDRGFLKKLLLHRIAFYQAKTAVKTSHASIPAGAFLIPAGQESSVIIGMLFDEKFNSRNRYAPKERYISYPLDETVDMAAFQPIQMESDADHAVNRLVNSMFKGQALESGPGESPEVSPVTK